MKVAFDEHIPPRVVDALAALDGTKHVLGVDIRSARDYATPKASSDVPWLQAFARDGGKVVLSGDVRMRGKLHEQVALVEAGFIVFFLASGWGTMSLHAKAALLLKWWPEIRKKLETARPGQFFENSCQLVSNGNARSHAAETEKN